MDMTAHMTVSNNKVMNYEVSAHCSLLTAHLLTDTLTCYPISEIQSVRTQKVRTTSLWAMSFVVLQFFNHN